MLVTDPLHPLFRELSEKYLYTIETGMFTDAELVLFIAHIIEEALDAGYTLAYKEMN